MMFYAVQLLGLFSWAIIVVMMTPAFIRTLRRQGSILDVFRGLIWFYGARSITGMTVGVVFIPPPENEGVLFARLGTMSLSLICAVVTVWVAYAYRKA